MIALTIEHISRQYPDWAERFDACQCCGSYPAHDPVWCEAISERMAPIAERADAHQAGCAVVAYHCEIGNAVKFGATQARMHDAARWATLARALGAWGGFDHAN
ncbi:hypothetical protein NRB_06690 [Novosphingobium sp. 11B]